MMMKPQQAQQQQEQPGRRGRRCYGRQRRRRTTTTTTRRPLHMPLLVMMLALLVVLLSCSVVVEASHPSPAKKAFQAKEEKAEEEKAEAEEEEDKAATKAIQQDIFLQCLMSMNHADDDQNNRLSRVEFQDFVKDFSEQLYQHPIIIHGGAARGHDSYLTQEMRDLFKLLIQADGGDMYRDIDLDITGCKIEDLLHLTATRYKQLHSVCKRTVNAFSLLAKKTPAPKKMIMEMTLAEGQNMNSEAGMTVQIKPWKPPPPGKDGDSKDDGGDKKTPIVDTEGDIELHGTHMSLHKKSPEKETPPEVEVESEESVEEDDEEDSPPPPIRPHFGFPGFKLPEKKEVPPEEEEEGKEEVDVTVKKKPPPPPEEEGEEEVDEEEELLPPIRPHFGAKKKKKKHGGLVEEGGYYNCTNATSAEHWINKVPDCTDHSPVHDFVNATDLNGTTTSSTSTSIEEPEEDKPTTKPPPKGKPVKTHVVVDMIHANSSISDDIDDIFEDAIKDKEGKGHKAVLKQKEAAKKELEEKINKNKDIKMKILKEEEKKKSPKAPPAPVKKEEGGGDTDSGDSGDTSSLEDVRDDIDSIEDKIQDLLVNQTQHIINGTTPTKDEDFVDEWIKNQTKEILLDEDDDSDDSSDDEDGEFDFVWHMAWEKLQYNKNKKLLQEYRKALVKEKKRLATKEEDTIEKWVKSHVVLGTNATTTNTTSSSEEEEDLASSSSSSSSSASDDEEEGTNKTTAVNSTSSSSSSSIEEELSSEDDDQDAEGTNKTTSANSTSSSGSNSTSTSSSSSSKDDKDDDEPKANKTTTSIADLMFDDDDDDEISIDESGDDKQILSVHTSFIIFNLENVSASDIDISNNSTLGHAFDDFVTMIITTVCDKAGIGAAFGNCSGISKEIKKKEEALKEKGGVVDKKASEDEGNARRRHRLRQLRQPRRGGGQRRRLGGQRSSWWWLLTNDEDETTPRRKLNNNNKEEEGLGLEEGYESILDEIDPQRRQERHLEGAEYYTRKGRNFEFTVMNPELYAIEDMVCPMAAEFPGKRHPPKCQTVFGHYNLLLTGLDGSLKTIENNYNIITASGIKKGRLRDSLQMVDRMSIHHIEGPGIKPYPTYHKKDGDEEKIVKHHAVKKKGAKSPIAQKKATEEVTEKTAHNSTKGEGTTTKKKHEAPRKGNQYDRRGSIEDDPDDPNWEKLMDKEGYKANPEALYAEDAFQHSLVTAINAVGEGAGDDEETSGSSLNSRATDLLIALSIGMIVILV